MRRDTRLLVVSLAALLLALPGAAAAGAEDTTPTFTKDVAPIFQQKCQACHRPGYIAPMSLMTYAESRPWARSIKTRVETRQMPPWHIDKSVGIQDFENDRSLTGAEIDTIVRWVDAGAPRGNPADMPPPVEFADDDVWNFAGLFGGPPDLVIHSAPYTVPAVAQDRWWKPEVPTGLTEDRWIRAIEIRPSSVDGRRITHHALARLQQEEDGDLGAASDVGPGLLMEWAVGKQGEIMRPNSGKLIKAGSSIVWDIPLPRGRRGDHRHGGARPVSLSQGRGAEAPAGALGVQHHRGGQRPPVDSAQPGDGDRALPRPEAERPRGRTTSRTCTCGARGCR